MVVEKESMQRPIYRASLSKSQDRQGWSVIFRHPVRRDEATGKPGKRVRRGLSTRDQSEAENLVDQINELLRDANYWNPAARAVAEKRFDSRVVESFFYKLVPEDVDYEALRERFIPLPSSENSEYRRVLLLGTTGAGKTTLVRQLIGTDPQVERFPSTSTAKTTIADAELLLDRGRYRAIVTFLSREEVREYVEECVSAAVLAAYREADKTEVMRRLLNHVNQRLRFNYLLGNGPWGEEADFDDSEEEDQRDETGFKEITGETLGRIDLRATNSLLASIFEHLREIARKHEDAIRSELNATNESDQRVIDELFEEMLDNLLHDDEAFHEVVDLLMDEIEKRFETLAIGQLNRNKQGWPLSWFWESDDRKAFIAEVLRFSSNYAPLFGNLLTPLVNGIRVAGPFSPTWSTNGQPKLVLLDGEGLGHTADSSASISTSIKRRFDSVDAVLLVDNAAQPMQAAPVAAMRELASSGKAGKLLFCFTHFDAVKGDNIPTVSAKERHVLASAENVLTAIGEDLGPFAERALRRRLEASPFFVGSIEDALEPTTKRGRRTIQQLQDLLNEIDKIVEKPEPPVVLPVYDRMNLVLAVKAAVESFHDAWLPRLGRTVKPGIFKEHWTRVKALSRRLAEGWQDEYDTLRPISDLHQQLQKRIYVTIQNPLEWTGKPSEDEMQQTYDAFADKVSRRLLDLATAKMKVERNQDWQDAYSEHGQYSTFRRAAIIAEQVYEKAAPIPDVTPSPDRNRFLHDVLVAVDAAAEEVGVTLR